MRITPSRARVVADAHRLVTCREVRGQRRRAGNWTGAQRSVHRCAQPRLTAQLALDLLNETRDMHEIETAQPAGAVNDARVET
jgi:hypothetical protein